MVDCKTEECDGILGHYPNGSPVECAICGKHKGKILQRDMQPNFNNMFALLFCSKRCQQSSWKSRR